MTPFRAPPDYPRWPEVARLIRSAFAYMAPILGHPARAMQVTPEGLARAAGAGAALLIEAEDRPVACLFTRPSRDVPDALYLGWLAVDGAYRGRRLARALIAAAEAEARGAGHAAMTLDTGRRLTDLHRFFSAAGFEATGGSGGIVSFRKSLAPAGQAPYRIDDEAGFDGALALIRDAFAFMDGRIDPPSSMHRLTRDSLAAAGEVWAIGRPPVACVVLTPQPRDLYLGKLAVRQDRRREGLARALIAQAENRGRALGLDRLVLQSRVELVENHAAFARLGFEMIGKTAHAGYDRPTSVTMAKELT